MPEEYLTFGDAMQLLGVTKPKLERLIQEEHLTIYRNKLDRRMVLLSRADILDIKEHPIVPSQVLSEEV